MVITQELEQIRDTIVNTVSVEKIYLFGSYARGEQRQDSDYDIYMLLPDDGICGADATENAYFALSDNIPYRKPIDILAGYSKVFNKRKEHPTLERIIAKEGVVIYDKK